MLKSQTLVSKEWLWLYKITVCPIDHWLYDQVCNFLLHWLYAGYHLLSMIKESIFVYTFTDCLCHQVPACFWYISCNKSVHKTLEQARVPFAEDDLPTVGLEALAEGNTEKQMCCWNYPPHDLPKKKNNSSKICYIICYCPLFASLTTPYKLNSVGGGLCKT